MGLSASSSGARYGESRTSQFSIPACDGGDPRVGDWGLCRAAYEKDSCGFGLIASLDDQASHWVLQTAISSLNRLTHRGAIAADGKTGDGCGLLIKQPTAFLRAAAAGSPDSPWRPVCRGPRVPQSRSPPRRPARAIFSPSNCRLEKLEVAGFRAMPVDPDACGSEALKTLPIIEQVFVNAGGDIDEATFNRKLYLARRRAEITLDGGRPGLLHPVACRPAPSSTRAW